MPKMLGLSDLIMGIMNGFEIIVIIFIIAIVVIFGAKKIPEIARSFGKVSTEYEKSRIESKKEIELLKNQNGTLTNVDREKLETIADTLGIDYSGRNDEDLRDAIGAEIRKKQT